MINKNNNINYTNAYLSSTKVSYIKGTSKCRKWKFVETNFWKSESQSIQEHYLFFSIENNPNSKPNFFFCKQLKLVYNLLKQFILFKNLLFVLRDKFCIWRPLLSMYPFHFVFNPSKFNKSESKFNLTGSPQEFSVFIHLNIVGFTHVKPFNNWATY